MEEITLYEQFICEMEKVGLRKEFATLEEKDVTLSEDDEVIYVAIPITGVVPEVNSYNTISIKGIRESSIRGRIKTHPYHISVKIYDYKGEEAKPEDAVQFSITEFKKGLPSSQEVQSHVIYYHYPYRIASDKLRFKRGIMITKGRRLEIRIMRNGVPLKIAKFALKMECDKWFKKEDESEKSSKKGDSRQNDMNNSPHSIQCAL